MSWRSAVLATHARTSGGCRLSEQNELTVMPTSVSPTRVVRTVTPEANRPRTDRNESGSIGGKETRGEGAQIGVRPRLPLNWGLTPIKVQHVGTDARHPASESGAVLVTPLLPPGRKCTAGGELRLPGLSLPSRQREGRPSLAATPAHAAPA